MAFTEVDICHQMRPLRMVVLRDLDFYFQGQTFSCSAFAIKNCSSSGHCRQICLDAHGSHSKVSLVQVLVRQCETLYHQMFVIVTVWERLSRASRHISFAGISAVTDRSSCPRFGIHKKEEQVLPVCLILIKIRR